MGYSLRSTDGNPKIAMSNYDAKSLMNKLPGYFKDMTFKNIGTKTVFVIEQGGNIVYGDIRIYFNQGEYFFPEGI